MRMRRSWVVLVGMLTACDPQAPADAGTPDGDAGGDVAHVQVELEVRDGDLPAGWRLERIRLHVDEVRVDNDRGGTMEPVWTPGESLDIRRRVVMELAGIPATYSGLTLRGDGGEEPTLEIELRMADEDRLEITSTVPYELALRCDDGPVRLAAAGELTVRARFDIATLVDALVGSLPDAEDGVVTIDEERTPDAMAAVEAAFLDGWTLRCDLRESD